MRLVLFVVNFPRTTTIDSIRTQSFLLYDLYDHAHDFVPDEILCSIISLVQHNEPIPSTRYKGELALLGKDYYGWIKVTHVNRRWRRVAVDDARLWTCLTLKLGTRWLDVHFLRHAQLSSRSRLRLLSFGYIIAKTPVDEALACALDLVLGSHKGMPAFQAASVRSLLLGPPEA